MPLDRRHMLKLMTAGAATSVLGGASVTQATARSAVKAVAFDAFPVFDPRPIVALAEALYPGKGAVLAKAWRTRQFEYQWLRALSGHYVDFRQATEDGLLFAAKTLKLEMSAEQRGRLMKAYFELETWPEVPAALKALREAGIRLAFLSNMTPGMLHAGISNAGLDRYFEHVISTDRARTYKPDPRAYRLAVDTLGLQPEEIVFAAFAGWDVAGAKWFGYPTFWVNRLGFPVEELGVQADAVGNDLHDLVNYVAGRNT